MRKDKNVIDNCKRMSQRILFFRDAIVTFSSFLKIALNKFAVWQT